jgi:glycerate 2-kinase
MNVLVVPDKFKGSLSSEEVSSAIRDAILSVAPSATVTTVPIADGGEGTARLLTALSGGDIIACRVSDPLGREIDSFLGIAADGCTAFIEMAAASGLQLLQFSERNPAHTSTVGTGQLIKAAFDLKIGHVVIGIGGSATNDGGAGLAYALGVRFLNTDGRELLPTGENLLKIQTIDMSAIDPRVDKTRFTILADVKNPLFGEEGAAHVFAPQKGASCEMVALLDRGLRHFHEVIRKQFGVDINFPGAGAAGGLGAGARFFLNAALLPGIEYLIQSTSLEERLSNADLVVTGEGKLDQQTLGGKVVSGIAALARKHGKPLWIVTGRNELTANELQTLHVDELIVLAEGDVPLQQSMTEARSLLLEKVKQRILTRPERS